MQSEIAKGSCTLVVPGDLSGGQDEEFCQRLDEAVGQRVQSIRLDCSDLDPVHSSHIGLLWRAREICRRASVKVNLANTNVGLRRTLEALDLAEHFVARPVESLGKSSTSGGITAELAVTHTSEFVPDVAGIDLAVNDFLGWLRQWDLSEEINFDLRTVFYEVATNIRLHAGLGPDDSVCYTAIYINGELRLVFRDQGIPFDPSSHQGNIDPHTAAQNRQTRGFGISLIKRLVDDITYERVDEGANVLSLARHCGEV